MMVEKRFNAYRPKNMGDTAVDGLMAGLVAGFTMALFLILAGLLDGISLWVTLGYFDPAQGGSWLSGSLAHLAVSAIYGVVFALLLRVAGRFRPSFLRLAWLLGIAFGLVLLAVAYSVAYAALPSPLAHIAAWQMGVAHLLYGLVTGLLQDQSSF